MAFNAREFFTRFATAVNARDRAALETMFHPEFTSCSPQTGEISHGFSQFWDQLVSYPGGAPDMPVAARLLGDDERWAITPSYTVIPLRSGNQFTAIDRTQYPDGSVWHTVAMAQVRDDLLYSVEFYFAPELPAPLAETIPALSGKGATG